MSKKTNIAWTDSTLNFWEGCTKVSDGCKNCYAEARDKRFTGGKLWGKGAPRRKSKSAVKDALAFNRRPWICPVCDHAMTEDESKGYRGCPLEILDDKGKSFKPKLWIRAMHVAPHHRRRIFSLSLGDWLDDEVPIEWLVEMLDTIRQCSDVTWILCTKRPENFIDRISDVYLSAKNNKPLADWCWNWLGDAGKSNPPPNIILLTSVENQATADKRIPELLAIPAACRGLSLEPLLTPVNLNIGHDYMKHDTLRGELKTFNSDGQCKTETGGEHLDWLIIGCESGAKRRDCTRSMVQSLVDQGQSAGVAVFVKQIQVEGRVEHDVNKFVPSLQVQQWPKGF